MIDIDWGSATAVGVRRSHNEDNLLTHPPVFMVADGMGGHAAGEVASGLVTEEFRRLGDRGAIEAQDVLTTLTRANDAVLAAARDDDRAGMGTTVVGLALVAEAGAEYWMAFNIGDSRLYRYYAGRVEQLSVDHAGTQEHRVVLTRVIGTDPGPAPNYCLRFPTAGERFLLCSDGVSLTDELMVDLFTLAEPASVVADRFVAAARAAGSTDDSTAVVVDVIRTGSDEPDESTHPRPGAAG